MDKEDMLLICNGIFSAVKNEVLSFAATWMDLESIILSEMAEKDKYSDVSYRRNLKRKQTNKQNKMKTDS